ncbi:MAG: amino acid ABC transporter permease, partial [Alphaproteobacteria bacterium]
MRRAAPAALFLAAAVALGGCASDNSGFTWGWHVVSPYTPRGQNNLRFLAEGFGMTIALSLATLALSLSLGLVVALLGLSGWAPFARLAPRIRRDASRVEQEASPMARLARWRPLGTVNRLYVEVFRSIPMLVMILWVFYGIPTLTGLQLTVFTAAMLAIALCDSAFEAEIFRGGIQSIDRGQREAARSLGLQPWQEMRLVVLPQAI